MSQHVGVRLERQLGHNACPFDHPGEAGGRKRSVALGRKHERRFRLLLSLQPPKGAQFVSEDRMRAGRALLDPTDVQGGGSEFDLLPAKINQLRSASYEGCRSFSATVRSR
jgi:hypothetical protein